MKILGTSFDYHDAAAAFVVDGKVIAAAQQERFSRVKNDSRFPREAIEFCLAKAGVAAREIDHVVHYERPILKFDRILRTALRAPRKARRFLGETATDWFRAGKFEVRQRIASGVGVSEDKISFCDHHTAHAAAAFFCSPFDEAAIVTIDGVGEYETATIAIGSGNEIRKLSHVNYPHSIGLFYSAFTAFLGFEVNEGEYKVMGMAGFGQPTVAMEILDLFDLRADGTFALKQDLFDFLMPETYPFTKALTKWLGGPRAPESKFDPFGPASSPDTERSRHYANIAASVQRATEEVILHIVRSAMKQTGLQTVCLAGGVALNSVANGRIQRELGARLYVHPAAGDAGSAIGAALHKAHCVLDVSRRGALVSPYLGPDVTQSEIDAALANAYLEPEKVHATDEELVEDVAERLASGAVIGWFQGRAEWGPRALGGRSILADPRDADTQLKVNEKIKFREPFRPFAPSVLAQRASEYFEIDAPSSEVAPDYFMLSVAPVKAAARAKIPAVTHVDGSARLHLVNQVTNPIYYALIKAFGDRTGVPVLLNTSFNLRGEPIVNSPADAIRTFQWSGMDALVLGRTVVLKQELSV
ncbi:MAG: carbamoyltransferase [Pseudolabrys sp.]